jgi:hypothetical protein
MGTGASEGPSFDPGRWRMAAERGQINWDAGSLMGRDWRISDIVVDTEKLAEFITAMKSPPTPKPKSKAGRKRLPF